ncbi:endonuclease/exonuclease/phosphatase family protein [Bacteroides sp.]
MGRKAVSRLFYYISILLTFILAGITVAGAFSGYTSPAENILYAFIGLALPVLLLLNFAVLIYWSIRLRIWLIVPLVAILGNWGYLSRVIRFSSQDSSKTTALATETTLTIATYNVDSFNGDQTGYSCKAMARYMKEAGSDIICMQEYNTNREFNADSVKATFSDWPYHSIPQATDKTPLLQIAVFSKYPILEQQLITYPDSRNCSMWCDIDVHGKRIRLFNNHLQTTEVSRNKRILEKELNTESGIGTERAALKLTEGLKENFVKRAAQAEQMRKLINVSPYPTLVCGDFNSLPSSYTYRTMKGDKLKDGFQSCGHGYMYTFRYFKKLLRIDYIFHTDDFKGLDYFSPDLDYSDHKPVVMKVKVASSQPSPVAL